MKAGMDLQTLALAVTSETERKRDLLVPASSMALQSNGRIEMLLPDPSADMAIAPHVVGSIANRQLGQYLGVPAAFWDQMHTQRDVLRDPYYPQRPLFDSVVNSLLQQKGDERRLVRALRPSMAQQLEADGVAGLPLARAFLSDRYRPIDNYEILERMLPIIANTNGINWQQSSLQLTDSRLYLKVTNERVQMEVRKGDVVQAGVMITNSEVGLGSFSVQPYYVRLVCLNGATATDFVKRKFHSGANWQRALGSDGQVAEYISDETIQALNAATILEMRDQVQAALGEAILGQVVERLRDAAEVRITGNPVAAVEELRDRFALAADERDGVLRHLINGADLSLYGLSNALNGFAQEVESYDRSTDLEVAAGRLLALPKHEVRTIVDAKEHRRVIAGAAQGDRQN